MLTSGWQAQIHRPQTGAFIIDPTEATAAVRRFVPEAGEAVADDPEFGVFLTDLTEVQRAELLADGWLHFSDDDYEINYEMP